jgi:signal transduction histidine kinase/DNA-binding response OmpR family regulator
MLDADRTNVLIVDDLPEKLLVYTTVLEELCQNLVTARSGAEALKQVLRQDFAVILLDVNMPGMDGLETAALIRQRKRSAHTPIIFMTAFADDVRAAEGYAQGAVDYILVPIQPDILRAKVKVFAQLFLLNRKIQSQADERLALAEERSRRAAAEEANRGLSFLARASAVLGQSLDYQVTARDVARLPVPFLADMAALVIAEPGGKDWQVIRTDLGVDGPAVTEASGRDQLSEDSVIAAERALAGERNATAGTRFGSRHDPTRTDRDMAGPARPEAGEASIVALALHTRGSKQAVLVLSRTPSGRAFAAADLQIAEALGSRAGAALDNAWLYQDIQRADRQKNEFLSMLAHELRNPLAPIRNALHVLQAHCPEQAELCWSRDIIDRQVKHMVRLVDDLLEIARITRGKIRLQLAPVELAGVVAQALEASRPLIESRKQRLEMLQPPEPLWVNGDSARLIQILTNLLNNAAKYTEEGGRIWLTAEREDGQAVLRVRDTGIGIPADMLAAVFDLFTQGDRGPDRSAGGLGIGLTLVRRLVELHAGSVQAKSEGPGRGSEFIVRLPMLSQGHAASEPPKRQSHSEPGNGHRVLVVDDSTDAAESLALLLRLSRCEVRSAHDGPAALEAAETFRPEVIILDIGLPGMNGYEVARRLRARAATRDTLLIAMTGYGQKEDRLQSEQAGIDHHLVKPVDFAILQDILASNGARTGYRATSLNAQSCSN